MSTTKAVSANQPQSTTSWGVPIPSLISSLFASWNRPKLLYNETCTVLEASDQHLKSGDVVWATWEGRPVLITSKPTLAENIFRDRSFYYRFGTDEGLRRLGMFKQGVIWNNDHSTWHAARHHGFQPHLNTPSLNEGAELAAAAMKRYIDKAVSSNKPFDMLKALRLSTLEVPLRVFLGIRCDIPDQDLCQIVDDVVAYFGAWEFFLCRPRPQERLDQDVAVANLRATAKRLLQMALEEDNGGTQFIETAQKSDHPDQLVLELLLATVDTSSVSLLYLLVHLAGSKGGNLQQQLYDTCDTHSDLPEKCLNEAMRFMPVGPIVMREAREATTCDDIDIDKGTCIVVNLAKIHRMREIFPNPGEFDLKNFAEKPSFFHPFGDGEKGCIGRHLAMREMLAVLKVVISSVHIALSEDQPVQCLEDVETRWDIANQPTSPILFTLTPRD
eukprot:TRINITY_DN19071_c0_g1_i1.p1 TRINITY_DN19071_c0_g1~~TRINITY_DN19071_c0_g1_i1.p1  ORF type:complete len:444 (+),score=67.32 TRINITY_DN19071_c0_g1_i1:1-1332(+)